MPTTTPTTPVLERRLSPFDAPAIIVANVIGGGILFRSPAVAAAIPDPVWFLLAWAAAFEADARVPVAGLQQLETQGQLSDGTTLSYAWGLVVDQWNGMRRVQHGGALAGYRTAIWRLPEQRWAGVVLCNSAEALPDAKMAELAWLYFAPDDRLPIDALQDVYTVSPGVRTATTIPDDIVGEYWSEELLTTWTIARRDTSYVLRRGNVPEQPLGLGPDGDVRIGGWQVVVQRDAAGVVTVLVVGAGRSSGVRFARRPSS